MKIIKTASGNTYTLYPDGYIRGHQPRVYHSYTDEEPVQVDGFLADGLVEIGKSMYIIRGPSGRSWRTSRVTEIWEGSR